MSSTERYLDSLKNEIERLEGLLGIAERFSRVAPEVPESVDFDSYKQGWSIAISTLQAALSKARIDTTLRVIDD